MERILGYVLMDEDTGEIFAEEASEDVADVVELANDEFDPGDSDTLVVAKLTLVGRVESSGFKFVKTPKARS